MAATSEAAYDLAGRLTALVHETAGQATIAAYAYVFDAAGQLVGQTDHGVTRSYSSDALGQVTGDGVKAFRGCLAKPMTTQGRGHGTRQPATPTMS